MYGLDGDTVGVGWPYVAFDLNPSVVKASEAKGLSSDDKKFSFSLFKYSSS